MWKFYGTLSGHLPHWRYEVNGKWYIGVVKSGSHYQAAISPSGHDVSVDGFGWRSNGYIPYYSDDLPEDETPDLRIVRQWLDMKLITGAV